MILLEEHDSVTKRVDKTYFEEPDFLENPVPPLFKCGHLLLPFQTVLEAIGGTVDALLSQRGAVQADGKRKMGFCRNQGGAGKV